MATDADEMEDGAEGDAPAKGGKTGLIIGLVLLLVLGGGGFGAWKFMGSKEDAKQEVAEVQQPPRYITLDPPFVVNFEAESMVRFLQVTIGVMTRDAAVETLVKDNDPRVRNDLLMILGNQTYATEKWSVTFTEQWISDGVLNKQYIQCTSGCPLPTVNNPTINNNFIPGALYFAVGGSYNIDEHWQLFGKIDNVTNVDPPAIAATAANSNAVNPSLYDTAGRMYRFGVRVNL